MLIKMNTTHQLCFHFELITQKDKLSQKVQV